MPDFHIEFQAYIDERKRPENFPKIVYVREQYLNVESDEQLKDIFNKRARFMMQNPGLVILPDNETIDMSTMAFHQRTYIPWHMITHFRGEIRIITPAPVEVTPLDSLIPQDPEATEKDKKAVLQ